MSFPRLTAYAAAGLMLAAAPGPVSGFAPAASAQSVGDSATPGHVATQLPSNTAPGVPAATTQDNASAASGSTGSARHRARRAAHRKKPVVSTDTQGSPHTTDPTSGGS